MYCQGRCTGFGRVLWSCVVQGNCCPGAYFNQKPRRCTAIPACEYPVMTANTCCSCFTHSCALPVKCAIAQGFSIAIAGGWQVASRVLGADLLLKPGFFYGVLLECKVGWRGAAQGLHLLHREHDRPEPRGMGAPWRCWQQVPPLSLLNLHGDTATCTSMKLQAMWCVINPYARVWKPQQRLPEWICRVRRDCVIVRAGTARGRATSR